MNQNIQFDPMMDLSFMPGIDTILPTPSVNTLNTYGPYEGFLKGNLFKDLYGPYKNYQPARIIPTSEQQELLLNLDQMAFAAHELNLYLDVHPDNREALKEFNEMRKMALDALETYEEKYGPVMITSNQLENYPFAWVENVWPWEKEAN